ncbi:MAG TPA: hypothetical protein VMU39_26625 [Solirubrobacteraceae bacterium]|nr:hypothetical protein [Solirubrobacteraceae bacterium]
MIAFVDPLQDGGRRGDVQRDRHLAKSFAADGKPSVTEHAQHQRVLGHHPGIKAAYASLRGNCSQLFEHPRPDPTTLLSVSHGKCDLGNARFPQPFIARSSHDATPMAADQRKTVNTRSLRGCAGDCVNATQPMEPKVTAAR